MDETKKKKKTTDSLNKFRKMIKKQANQFTLSFNQRQNKMKTIFITILFIIILTINQKDKKWKQKKIKNNSFPSLFALRKKSFDHHTPLTSSKKKSGVVHKPRGSSIKCGLCNWNWSAILTRKLRSVFEAVCLNKKSTS